MLEIFSPDPKECKIHSDSFHDLPDRGRVYGRGHMEMYRDIVAFIEIKRICKYEGLLQYN